MINFSKIKESGFLGKILRTLLKLIPKRAILPIVQGPLRGYKWVVRSGVFGYWLGSYEAEKQKAFTFFVREGDVVYDLGAHVGFYSLLASKLVGNKGSVFSFEPFPQNVSYLKKHIALNNIKNIIVLEKGISFEDCRGAFDSPGSSAAGRINDKKSSGLSIEIASIDSLLERKEIAPPNVIKMDIEGGEYNALRGAEKTLKKYDPVIVFATHSQRLRNECVRFLQKLDYTIKPVSPNIDVDKQDELIATRSLHSRTN